MSSTRSGRKASLGQKKEMRAPSTDKLEKKLGQLNAGNKKDPTLYTRYHHISTHKLAEAFKK